MKSTELAPYAYTPYSTPLTRCTMPDGTTEYRHSKTGKPVDVDQENLFDLISCTHEQLYILVDMLPEKVYAQYAYIFKGLIQNISATMAEAQHYIQEAGVEIKVATLRKNHFLARNGAVVDAMLKGVNHAG